MTSWWARAISDRSFFQLKWRTMSAPKRKPAPRGERPQPSISSGSDHSRSHMAPSWGTSCLRSMRRILSTVSMRGLSPPRTQRMAPVEGGGKGGGGWSYEAGGGVGGWDAVMVEVDGEVSEGSVSAESVRERLLRR